MRELTCFSSTTVWVKSAACDVVEVALVSTCAGPFFQFRHAGVDALPESVRRCVVEASGFLWEGTPFLPFPLPFLLGLGFLFVEPVTECPKGHWSPREHFPIFAICLQVISFFLVSVMAGAARPG